MSSHRKKVLVAAGLAAGAGAFAAWLLTQSRRRRRQRVSSEHFPAEAWRASHAQKVRRIADRLRAQPAGSPVSLRKRSVSHEVPKAGDLRRHDDKVDVSDLTDILLIDPLRRICIAESGVAFVDLVAATMRYGMVPIVVPELKTITIGGAVSGCSIESMSYRYGGFHDTCIEYELITSTGEILTCTADNTNHHIFQMLHGTFGTLGVLSMLTFRLIEAKPFVKVTYEKYASLSEYQAGIARHYSEQDVDFMDGIIHSPKELVLSVGNFVANAPYHNRYDWTKVYFLSTRERREDYLRTPDYFFRYDLGVTNVHPRSFIGRLLFAKLLGSSTVLRLAEVFHRLLPREQPTVILDVFLPAAKVEAFFTWYRREIDFFPLWCVPYRRMRRYEWLSERFTDSDPLFIDLAIYGLKQPRGKNFHKMVEDKLLELGGIKTLISHNYYSEKDFWTVWNKPNYDRVKSRTDPKNIFRDLYAKTCKAAMGVSTGPELSGWVGKPSSPRRRLPAPARR